MKCDNCEKRKAEYNFQKTWVAFRITKKGNYKPVPEFNGADVEEPTDDDNQHLCSECAESLFSFSE